MLTFEVIVYNEKVRELLRDGEHHKRFSDDWGDSHYIEIKADDENSALAKVQMRYPERDGFVVEDISRV